MVRGVMVGESSGWVRVFSEDDNGTLVYLTRSTGIKDVCRDLVLPEYHTLWVQYGGGEGRRLGSRECPLTLQDDCLRRLGYGDHSRRARLGIDPDLRHIIKFHVGPSSEGGGRSGSVLVLKGLVLPQWRRRDVEVVGDKLFIHPGPGSSADTEVIELKGAEVEAVKSTRCGRRVLRVSSATRQLFLGFDSAWERQMWCRWLTQASESEGSGERLDLSGSGLERLPTALLSNWPDLRELAVSRNRLAGELSGLERLAGLRRLEAGGNLWAAVPPGLARLRRLQHLDLSDNRLAVLPSSIARLPRLEELRVDRNVLTSLPGGEGVFPALRHLSASHNLISTLPDFLQAPEDMRALLEACEGRQDRKDSPDLNSVNLRANALKGNIVLANYGVSTSLLI